jgi:hypothetical protein
MVSVSFKDQSLNLINNRCVFVFNVLLPRMKKIRRLTTKIKFAQGLWRIIQKKIERKTEQQRKI